MIVTKSFRPFPESKYQNLQKVLFCHCGIGNPRPIFLCDEIESIQFPNGIVLIVSADKNIHYLDLFTFSLKANAIQLLLSKCGAKFLQ